MVKKVKRFIVFLLFLFFYSLLGNKEANAAGTANRICIIPKNSSNKLIYNNSDTGHTIAAVAEQAGCSYN